MTVDPELHKELGGAFPEDRLRSLAFVRSAIDGLTTNDVKRPAPAPEYLVHEIELLSKTQSFVFGAQWIVSS